MLLVFLGVLTILSHSVFGPPPRACRLSLAPIPEPPAHFAWSPGGERLVVACQGGIYQVGDAGPKPASTSGARQPSGMTAWSWETQPMFPEVLARLRTWKVPGVPAEDPVDLTLAIGPPAQGADREFALGRRVATVPFGPYRPQPQISPNGRYVAAVAGDGTLRLLDLKASAPRAGAQ